MQDEQEQEAEQDEHEAQPAHRIRLPGFIVDREIGVGDVIKRMTSAVGVKPCGGCRARAAAMNRWLAFTNRGRR